MDILQIPFVGAYELRKNLPVLLRQLQKGQEGVVVTQKGKPAGMLISLKAYQEMKMLNEELEDALKELADKKFLVDLARAVEVIKAGGGKEAKKIFKDLKI
jgi:prevent-host-death family protein